MEPGRTEYSAGASGSGQLITGSVATYGSTSTLTSIMSKQPSPEGPAVLITDVESLGNEGDIGRTGSPPIASINKNEPVVTRKELWSYYRTSSPRVSSSFGYNICEQSIITETM